MLEEKVFQFPDCRPLNEVSQCWEPCSGGSWYARTLIIIAHRFSGQYQDFSSGCDPRLLSAVYRYFGLYGEEHVQGEEIG